MLASVIQNSHEFESCNGEDVEQIRKEILQRTGEREREKKNRKEENRIEGNRSHRSSKASIVFRDINVDFREVIRFGVLSDSTASCAQSLSSYGLRSRLLPLNHKWMTLAVL